MKAVFTIKFACLQTPMFIIIFLFLVNLPLSAATYYFSASGSDNNNGLSAGAPKRSISAAMSLMGNGNVILFKRGDKWYIPDEPIYVRSFDLSGKSNFTIDAYHTGDKPVIAHMGLLDGTWTHTGNNIWMTTDTRFFHAHRVFVNGVSRINLLHKVGNTNTLSNLDSTDEFYYSSNSLYLKTTSSTIPPANVEIIPGWHAPDTTSWANFVVMRMKNTTNAIIKNIEFRGGSSARVIYIEAPCSNITFDNCIIGRATRDGLFATSVSPYTSIIEDISVINCVVDKGWTLAENNIKETITSGGQTLKLVLQGDGISFNNGIEGGLIKENQVTNWGHEGITLAAFWSQSVYGVKHVKIEANEVWAGNSGYMHAFGLVGLENKVQYNIVKRNFFRDFSSGCNVSGSINFIFSNIFARITPSPILHHSQAPWAINLATWSVDAGEIESRNNWICNNTFYRTDAYSIWMSMGTSDVTGTSGNKIMNNIMMRFGQDTSYPRDPEHPNAPRKVGLKISHGLQNGVTYIRNNNFWPNCDPGDCDTSLTRRVAEYGLHTYTASSLNGCAECLNGSSSGNVQLNPRFDNFFGLTPYSSSTLRWNGYIYKANITNNWGLPAAEFVDYNNLPWPEDSISVGAVQYTGQ